MKKNINICQLNHQIKLNYILKVGYQKSKRSSMLAARIT